MGCIRGAGLYVKWARDLAFVMEVGVRGVQWYLLNKLRDVTY